jgi:hypothetical protein
MPCLTLSSHLLLGISGNHNDKNQQQVTLMSGACSLPVSALLCQYTLQGSYFRGKANNTDTVTTIESLTFRGG